MPGSFCLRDLKPKQWLQGDFLDPPRFRVKSVGPSWDMSLSAGLPVRLLLLLLLLWSVAPQARPPRECGTKNVGVWDAKPKVVSSVLGVPPLGMQTPPSMTPLPVLLIQTPTGNTCHTASSLGAFLPLLCQGVCW